MNAQAATMGSMDSFKKVLSISAIVYRFTMVLFMMSCMIFFYKTYKYNVGIFHLQKQLNARFSVEDNYNGALVNIEYTDENILKESKMDHPKIEEEASVSMFAFNFLERVFNVQKDTYVYETGSDKLLQIIPAKNNMFQEGIVQLKIICTPTPYLGFEKIMSIAVSEVKKEQDRRMYAWHLQQKLKKEREEAIKNNQLIEEEDDSQVQSNLDVGDNTFKITDSRDLKINGGVNEGLK